MQKLMPGVPKRKRRRKMPKHGSIHCTSRHHYFRRRHDLSTRGSLYFDKNATYRPEARCSCWSDRGVNTSSKMHLLRRCRTDGYQGLCEVFKPDQALYLFQRMVDIFGCKPGIKSYNSMFNAFIESNQWSRESRYRARRSSLKRAKRLLNWMSEKGLNPNVLSYGTLINALAKDGKLSDAVAVFDEMSERGMNPDVMCYNILIDGFFRKGDFEKTTEIWERLLRDSSVYPSVATYNIMINGLCKLGKFDESMEIWNRMKNQRSVDLFTFSSMIHGLSKAGNSDAAEKIYLETIDSGLSPDVPTYNTMLRGLFRAAKLSKCFELWEEMGLFDNKKVEEAICNWQLLHKRGLRADSRTYGVLIHGLCKNGYLNEALRILKEAENEDADLDTFVYSSMIHGLCKKGRLEQAVELIHQMNKHKYKLNSHIFNSLINGCIRASKLEKAIFLLREMSNKDCAPTVVSYNTIINSLCKVERFSDAYLLLKEMLEEGLKPDMITYSLLIDGLCMDNIIIHGLCTARKVDVALEIFTQMAQVNCVPDLVTHNTIMEGVYKAGDCQEALKIWDHAIGFLYDALHHEILPTATTWNILVRAVVGDRSLMEYALIAESRM
ncbi:Pentatricopeptide repeat-containing protein, partial [Cucurbita argyrosperma subsp. argyrosperma]